jgi:L-aminopeptidase/D-esterase-like protein
MITDIAGVRVGHWTDERARTGCTVVLLPEGTVASGEVRGGAPATREFELLDPHRTVARLDAVVLAGGSAFGLAAADGVVRFCEEQGRGFPTAAGPVPIVVAMALFDLMEGDGTVRPTAADGHEAATAAAASAEGEAPPQQGRVGAGTGATVAKWLGREHARPGGLGSAIETNGGLLVAALVAVNAVGDLPVPGVVRAPIAPTTNYENTTLAVVATNAKLTKLECSLAARAAHDGFARALDPAHTAGDGDAVVVAATGELDADATAVPALAAVVVEQAIRSALAP